MVFLLEPWIIGSWKLCYREYWFTLKNNLSLLPNTVIWKVRRCILNAGFPIPLHAVDPSSFPSCTVWHRGGQHWQDSGDKPSVTCVACVPQTENAFCTAKWMHVKLCLLERASSKHSTEGMLGGAAATQSWAGTTNMRFKNLDFSVLQN